MRKGVPRPKRNLTCGYLHLALGAKSETSARLQSVALLFRPARFVRSPVRQRSGLKSTWDCCQEDDGRAGHPKRIGRYSGQNASKGKAGTTSKKAWRPGVAVHMSLATARSSCYPRFSWSVLWDVGVVSGTVSMRTASTTSPCCCGWSQHSLEGRATSQGSRFWSPALRAQFPSSYLEERHTPSASRDFAEHFKTFHEVKHSLTITRRKGDREQL